MPLAESRPVLEAEEVSAVGWFFPLEIKELDRFEWIDRVIDDIGTSMSGLGSDQSAPSRTIT